MILAEKRAERDTDSHVVEDEPNDVEEAKIIHQCHNEGGAIRLYLVYLAENTAIDVDSRWLRVFISVTRKSACSARTSICCTAIPQ